MVMVNKEMDVRGKPKENVPGETRADSSTTMSKKGKGKKTNGHETTRSPSRRPLSPRSSGERNTSRGRTPQRQKSLRKGVPEVVPEVSQRRLKRIHRVTIGIHPSLKSTKPKKAVVMVTSLTCYIRR